MLSPAVDFWLYFEHFVFSSSCLLCRQPTTDQPLICAACKADLPWLAHHCRQCAEPLSRSKVATAVPLVCGRCLQQPPAFDRTLAALQYQFPVNRLIASLKQRARLDILELATELFVDRFESQIIEDPPQLIIPVPLHGRRLYQRGYNQAAEWSRRLSKRLAIPCDSQRCQRVIDTPHQQGLSARQRRLNLRRAFVVKQPAAFEHVAIVDDVMTTGTTLDLLAQVLKHSGVRRVDAWCLARTPGLQAKMAASKQPPNPA